MKTAFSGSSPTNIEPNSTSRASLISAMSYALDITEGQPPGHAARTCLIGMRLARKLQLPKLDCDALYYSLLLKDLGCSSNAAKMCYLFGSDDRVVKRDVKKVDWAKMKASFQFMLTHVSPDKPPLHRALKMAATILKGPKSAKRLVETRCERGASLARKMGFSELTATAILQLDEHWNGAGHPKGLKGDEISLLARILGIAQTTEVFHREFGRDAAITVANERSGRWFDPKLVEVFCSLESSDPLWQALLSPSPHKVAEQLSPPESNNLLDESSVDRIAEAFADVVDAKSPWTHLHSTRVAKICVGMGQVLGLPEVEMNALHRVGLLHDIGKLGVSNAILDKPGKLTDEEFGILKSHPEHSYIILSRAECFGDLADIAGSHHEKINGSGYHRSLTDSELPLACRIITVADMFEAMTAKRPYRDGMPIEKTLGIIEKESGRSLCGISVEALKLWIHQNDYQSRIDEQLQSVEDLVAQL